MSAHLDLREQDLNPITMGIRLRRDWPEPFDNLSLGGDASGVNAAVLVLRHLFSFQYTMYGEAGRKSIVETAGNPILEAAWMQFSPSEPAHEVRASLVEKIKAAFAHTGLSFFDIMEGELTRRTLWSQRRFSFYTPTVQFREIFPDNNLGPLQTFDIDDLPNNGLYRESLLEWDGTDTLEAFIHTRFGRFKEARYPILINRRSNGPNIIRVRYTPVPGHPRAIDDVRFLKIQGHTWVDGEMKPESWPYTLAAAVALRCEAGTENDEVHTYFLSGMCVEGPHRISGQSGPAWDHVLGNWFIGQPGRSYMLYLVATLEGSKPDAYPEKVYRPASQLSSRALISDILKELDAEDAEAAREEAEAARVAADDSRGGRAAKRFRIEDGRGEGRGEGSASGSNRQRDGSSHQGRGRDRQGGDHYSPPGHRDHSRRYRR